MSISIRACCAAAELQPQPSSRSVTFCTSHSATRSTVKVPAWRCHRVRASRSDQSCACSEIPTFPASWASVARGQFRWDWVCARRFRRDFRRVASQPSPSHLYWRCSSRRTPKRRRRWAVRWGGASRLWDSVDERKRWRPRTAQCPSRPSKANGRSAPKCTQPLWTWWNSAAQRQWSDHSSPVTSGCRRCMDGWCIDTSEAREKRVRRLRWLWNWKSKN